MTKNTLLRIDTSIRNGDSHSRQAGDHFEKRWLENHPNATIQRRDLANDPPPHLDGETLGAFFAGDREEPALQLSNHLIDELKNSDAILITCPVYNFHLPSTLKAWIDHIVRAGETFAVDSEGRYRGLLDPISTFVVIAQGARIESPEEKSPAASYLAGICGFLGLGCPTFFPIDGTADASFAELRTREVRAEIDRALTI